MKIQNKRKEENLHYPTLKDRKPSLKTKLLAFRPNPALFIGKRWFQKTRRGHASKIDAWPHQIAVETLLLPRFRGNTWNLGPWFWCGDVRRFGDLLDILRIGYFHSDLHQTPARV